MKTFNHEIQQYPEELDWLIGKLLEANVSSLLTIGVFHAGVEFFTSQRFQQANRPLSITAVDPYESPQHYDTVDMIREECSSLIKLEFIYKRIEDVSDLGQYDAVLVDGEHDEASVWKDVTIAFKHATKLVAMHDIVCAPHTVGSYNVWNELKSLYTKTDYISVHPDIDKGWGVFYLC